MIKKINHHADLRRTNNIGDSSAQSFSFTTEKETKINFADNCLPTEVILKILSDLNVFGLVRSQRVSKLWNVVASDAALWENAVIPEIIGKTQWKKYFGDVGEVPTLPQDIEEILESPCPFFSGKKVKETHMLVLIPETSDGKPLTLAALGKLVEAPKEGKATQYRTISDAITRKYGQATPKAHWALMTKNVIEGSRNKNYTDQQALITEFNKQTGLNYEVPNALDAVICIFMHSISSGEYLFNDEPFTYTRCLEDIDNRQIIVGNFSSAGLDVDSDHDFDCDCIGVAALRKL